MSAGNVHHCVQQQCYQRDSALLQRDPAERQVRDLPIRGAVRCSWHAHDSLLHLRDPGIMAQHQEHAGAHEQCQVR